MNMQNYKFRTIELKENYVEIKSNDKKEALQKLVEYLGTNDKNLCEKISSGKNGFYILLNEISNETRRTFIDDDDEINENIIKYLLSDDEDLYKKCFLKEDEDPEYDEEEIEDDLPNEYTEICCGKCGNCIPIDEIIHLLDS